MFVSACYRISSGFSLLAEFLVAIVTQSAKDLAERRPKNNTHTSIGTNECFNNVEIEFL